LPRASTWPAAENRRAWRRRPAAGAPSALAGGHVLHQNLFVVGS
jgi:hypothetical protein